VTTRYDELILESRTCIEDYNGRERDCALAVIELGKMLAHLKACVKRDRLWAETVALLGYSVRYAGRLVVIGESGWATQTPADEVLAQLPSDVEKLEWLSKLTPEQLSIVLKGCNAKEADYGEVIAEVTEQHCERLLASAPQEVSVTRTVGCRRQVFICAN
jgi:hypothetical protein